MRVRWPRGDGAAAIPIALTVLGLLGSLAELAGQTPVDVRDRCVAAGGDANFCAAAGVAVRAMAGDVGLAAGLGSEVAGTASNLGERLGEAPRWSIGGRAGVVRGAVPDLRSSAGLGEASYDAWSVQAEMAAGLFDGIRIRPGVGGFLALDLLGRMSFVLLPAGEGFEGSATGFTVGARVGLLRESFDLPGISVSVSRRWIGDVILSDTVGDPIRLSVDPSVTSVRATVGKDVLAWQLLAGFGWDDYAADADFVVPGAAGGAEQGSGSIDAGRTLWFLGASRSFNVVFSLSLEVGVADGFGAVEGFNGSDFDPTRSTLFAGAALRLTI